MTTSQYTFVLSYIHIIQLPRYSGIYIIRCTVNGKIYVGSSKDLRRRSKEHLDLLDKGTHHNTYLQNAWEKYGEGSFVFDVIELCEEAILLEREQYWMDVTKCFDERIGYNMSLSAVSPTTGRPRSLEVKQRIGDAQRGRKASPETRMRQSLAKKGKPGPNLGKKFSPAHCANIGKTKVGNRNNNGRIHTKEHIEKIAETKRRDYVVTTPDGIEVEVHGIKRFCRENDLNCGHMVQVARGTKNSYKGWKCRYAEHP